MKNLFKEIQAFFDKLCAPEFSLTRKITYFFFELLSLIGVFMLLSSPICIAPIYDELGVATNHVISPIALFANIQLNVPALLSFAFIQLGMLVFIAIFILAILYKIVRTLLSLSNEEEMATHTKNSLLIGAAGVFVYTLFAYFFSPINKALGGHSLTSVKIFPLIYIALVCIIYAVYSGIISSTRRRNEDAAAAFRRKTEAERKKLLGRLLVRQLELIIFTVASAGIAIYSMLVDIITVKFEVPGVEIPDYIISGKKLLLGINELTTKNERTFSFIFSLLFILTALGAFFALISFLSRSMLSSKIAIGSIITSTISCTFIGLFGLYYQIVQELNEEIILSIISEFAIISEDLLAYTAKSDSLLYCALLLGVLTLCFFRHPYSKAAEIEKKLYSSELSVLAPEVSIIGDVRSEDEGSMQAADPEAESTAPAASSNLGKKESFDPCPAFTEIDAKLPVYNSELEKKRQAIFTEPTLPHLVEFIVQYARDSRLHLFYTPESIATFLAGLGSTKLTILQGMSGTGKTSLPKIVSEALASVCDIVEVESSWRDKNELLGYYNEFNKVYTPKKFTQALYRARLNSDTLTFIVLDEMNLSRIEYYFSDFLSLMENEPDKRELKLLNVPLARTYGGKRIEYKGLVDGHTLMIPSNVWFIGTANRDESTYDISDKVYDRAHTMNFDKRAPKPQYYGEPSEPRYLPADKLIEMFEDAKETVKFDIDMFPVVAKVEKLLEPYNISFGNRIAMQIESFVKIYAACFAATDAVIHDALETILLSKVVKKLELKSVDDKEDLAAEFEKLHLMRCAKFVKNLRED